MGRRSHSDGIAAASAFVAGRDKGGIMTQAKTASSSAHGDVLRDGCAIVSESVGLPRVKTLDGAP